MAGIREGLEEVGGVYGLEKVRRGWESVWISEDYMRLGEVGSVLDK